jgi:sigma-B regulation protein RsbU (phosphoserine phosphatase)
MTKFSISTRRLHRLLVLLFLIAAARRITYTVDAVADMRHEYTGCPVGLGDPWPTVAWTRKVAEQAGLRAGDRILSIGGRAPQGLRGCAQAFHARRPGETVALTVLRAGQKLDFAVRPYIPAFGRSWLSLAFGSLNWIVMPWLCFALGFWVAAMRPRDPRAWIVLGILLSMAEFTNAGILDARSWPGFGMVIYLYHDIGDLWGIFMLLFGFYFPQRWRFDRYAPWFKWALVAPSGLLALWDIARDALLSANYPEAERLLPYIPAFGTAALVFSLMTPCLFFIALQDRFKDQSLAPDDRRRLRLLYWGCTAALSPLFLLTLFTLIFYHRMPGDQDDLLLAISLLAVLLFPLTMAYVLVVQRAMDVRVVIRQGLQYALAQGGVRVIQVCVIVGISLLAVNSMDNHTSGPERLTLMAVGLVVILRVRQFGEKVRGWVDKRFFREAYNAEQILSELSEQVRAILDTRALLDTVARKLSESLHVDRVAVMLREGAWFRPALAEGYFPPLELALPADSNALEPLRRSREPVAPEPGSPLAPLDAQLLLPLASKKELLGFIGLGPKKSGEPYSPSDTQLLRTVASQTGLALENSRLSEAIAAETAQREMLSREIEIAREVQQRLFPQTMPEIAEMSYAGHCRPARGVGGDYYDFLELPNGCLGIAIGDVSGKGIPAALLMASLQASVRGQSYSRGNDVAGLMANVNRLVYDASPSNRYATFFYAQFDPATRRMIYVNGGHNPPMVLRGEETIRLEAGGPPVGLFRPAQYEQAEVQLDPGDLLVLFTDGISEAENPANDEWGEDALEASARACNGIAPAEAIERIMRNADQFVAGAPQHDDMTLVVARMV